MKAVPTDWTVVVTGNWNISIFNPDWVAKNVFQQDGVEVEVGLGSGQTTLRVRSASAILIPLNDRIIIGMRSDDKNLVEQLESYAIRILSLLPHTPVASYGNRTRAGSAQSLRFG